jgi:phage shock protein PspC (stress-responsive transcriptional regulator)
VNPRRLYRSRDRQLAGVAGGMADYLDIDPTVVRILWVIVGFASGGLALVAYFVLALVVPQAPYLAMPGGWAPGAWAPTQGATGAATGWSTPPTATSWSTPPAATGAAWSTPAAAPGPGWDPAAYAQPQVRQHPDSRGIGAAGIVGVVLIVIGAIALADVVLPGWAAGAILGPAVILTLGAALLASSVRRRPDEAPQAFAPVQAAAPAPTGTSPIPPPWDATDTQTVGPATFAPASGTPSSATEEGSSRPA